MLVVFTILLRVPRLASAVSAKRWYCSNAGVAEAVLGGSSRTPREAWEKVGAQLQEMELKPGELEKWSKGGGR